MKLINPKRGNKKLHQVLKGNMRCKECKFFKRKHWHKSQGGGTQLCGTCDILLKILKINNSSLFHVDVIVLQDTFGCVLGKAKDT